MNSWVLLAVKVNEPNLECALDEAHSIADHVRKNPLWGEVTVLNTVPAPSNQQMELFPMKKSVQQTYLDREIKARLERGDSHKDIAACCNVNETDVERLASEST